MDPAASLAFAERACDVAFLDDEAARRGVSAVLADMHAALPSVKALAPRGLAARFTSLLAVVEAEAHALEAWAPSRPGGPEARLAREPRYPRTAPPTVGRGAGTASPSVGRARGAFLQQIRNRALELRLPEIQRDAEQRLDELNAPHLRERSRTGRGTAPLRRTLRDEAYEVNAAVLAPGGKQAISGTRRAIHPSPGGVTIWSTETGQIVSSFIAHPDQPVTCLAVTRDDRLLLTGSSDNTARVWDRTTNRRIFELRDHRAAVWAIATSPNSALAVTASLDATLRVWDLETGRMLRSLDALREPPMEVIFLPDGRTIAVVSANGALSTWDVASGAQLSVARARESGAASLGVSRHGDRALTGHRDGSIRAWDLARGEVLSVMRGHTADVIAVRFSGFERAVSASRDGTLRLWDIERGVEMDVLGSHAGPVTGLDVDEEGLFFVSSAKDGAVCVWDRQLAFREIRGPSARRHPDRAEQLARPWAKEASRTAVRRVAVSLDGRWAATAHVDRSLTVWDLASGDVVQAMPGHRDDERVERIEELRISADGRALVTAALVEFQRCALTLWDVASGTAYREIDEISPRVGISGDARWAVGVRRHNAPTSFRSGGPSVGASSPSGDPSVGTSSPSGGPSVGAATPGGVRGSALCAWNMETGRIERVLLPDGEVGDVWNIVVSASGDRAAYHLWHANVRTWDVFSERKIHEMDGFVSLVMSGDGRRLIVKRGGYEVNDFVRVYDLDWSTGVAACRQVFEIPGSEQMGLSFTGRHLAWQDGGLVLLDLEDGAEEILRLRTDARLTCSAFTPDGRTIVAGDAAGAIHILDLRGIETG